MILFPFWLIKVNIITYYENIKMKIIRIGFLILKLIPVSNITLNFKNVITMSKTPILTSTTEYYVNGQKVAKSFFEKTYKKCVSLVPMSFKISKERKKTGEITYLDTYNLIF